MSITVFALFGAACHTDVTRGARKNAGAFVTVQVQQKAQRAATAKEAKLPKYGHVIINPTDCANTESKKVTCSCENPLECLSDTH